MSETQPYRLFKEFLDTIIQIPENIKIKLADEFERRRLDIQKNKLQEESENKLQEESENKLQEESENKLLEESENKSQEDTTIENKSYFDDIFSKKQTDNMLNKFSKTPSTLSLKHKCQIRPW
jgi:CRISPR/Cas system CSM-associated protein Csm3 (group 7 of RAMP superfamily)